MASRLVLLVEEPSMEAFLKTLLPRMLPDGLEFDIRVFGGKADLLGKLDQRLRAYQRWLPPDWRLVVIVDRDNDDCHELKAQLEESATNAGLRIRSQAGTSAWQLVNRVVIEELEAWFFGDWEAVRAAYPKVNPNVPQRSGYREPDDISGAGVGEQRVGVERSVPAIARRSGHRSRNSASK
ncbi:MAG: DUF4276 family protein [Gammaproteobacteria bacterium]|nr:DUF4276 family protein [Gammaproteobacteria bacterium]